MKKKKSSTCIIGYNDRANRRIWMGGDGAAVGDTDITQRTDVKVWTDKGFIFGASNSFRMMQLLKYKFGDIANKTSTYCGSDHEYMCRVFVDHVKRILRDGGVLNEDGEMPGRLLVGFKGELYYIECDFHVGTYVDDYMTIGCASDLVLGAMSVLHGLDISGYDKVNNAMSIATKYSTSVCDPVTIKYIDY